MRLRHTPAAEARAEMARERMDERAYEASL